MYAKFIHPHKVHYFNQGILRYANRVYANPTHEMLTSANFKPVIDTRENTSEGPILYREHADHISIECEVGAV